MPIAINSDNNSRVNVKSNQEIDLITNGQPRFRVETTGQVKAVYESSTGTDYNTTMHNGYLCRAWVNFNGNNVSIRASGNVSSVSYDTAGLYTVTMLVSMPDSSYAVTTGCASYAGGGQAHFSTPRFGISAGSFTILLMDPGLSQVNSDQVYAMAVR